MEVIDLHPESVLADDLQRIVDRLRSGDIVADSAVLVMRNGRDAMMHKPANLGRRMTHTEIMGVLSYGTCHYYQAEVSGE
ncbi:MAG: hypothetical protein ACREO4_09360 [Lysobacter sp.]